jgi:hypothetical protein
MNTQLKERKLEELSNLRYRIYTYPLEEESYPEAVMVAFEGEYGIGSKGNGDAVFMRAVIMMALEAWQPQALVIDLREMTYVWGDYIVTAIAAGQGRYFDMPFPTAIVVSDRNRQGLTSLISDEMDADPSQWLFDTLEEAVRAVKAQ